MDAVAEHDRSREADGPARVLCNECGFRWYGLTAVHGLEIIGRCPRCSGTLHFCEHVATAPVTLADAEFEVPIANGAGDSGLPEAVPRARRASGAQREPSRVLGVPQSWNR